MDSLKNAVGTGDNKQNQNSDSLGDIRDKLSSTAEGGSESDKGEKFSITSFKS